MKKQLDQGIAILETFFIMYEVLVRIRRLADILSPEISEPGTPDDSSN